MVSIFKYLKTHNMVSTIYKIKEKVCYKISDLYFKMNIKISWKLFLKKNETGISTQKRTPKVIVSLTSFPARIDTVNETIKSLLMQTFKPNMIVLWLGKDKFPDKEKNLPQSLLALKKYGLTIEWCKDMGSYTKLVPSLKKWHDQILISVDDDIIYPLDTVEKLYYAYEQHPEYIHCHRVTKYILNSDGKYELVGGGWDTYGVPSFLHKQTGVGGVLYPPDCLYKDVTDDSIFREIAHLNDDAWFWLMGVLTGYKVSVVENPNLILHYVGKTQNGPSQYRINDNFIWPEFYNILNRYPILKDILREESVKMNEQNQ